MMADYIGQQLGNYRLRQIIGRGGSADVYLGEHIHLGTLAAIKVLHIQMGKSELDNFLREARMIAHLRHPHIVRVLDFGVEGNIPFLVMDYAAHGTLRQCYPKGTRLPLATILAYTRQVAQALQYAHEQKIIHRDVKPENMLLDSDGQLLLSDFGISSIEQSTSTLVTQKRTDLSTVGTVYYMAPEQIQGHPHFASDQYALGVVVYEWLCGARPFTGAAIAVMYQHVHMPPVPLQAIYPAISPAIEHVVLRALAKDPGQRFATIKDFAQALEQASKVYVAPPLPIQPQQVLKPISMVKPLHPRKDFLLPMSLITLIFIVAFGGVAFILSSLNNHSHAIATTNRSHTIPTPVATAPTTYNSATTSQGMMAGFNSQHTRFNPYEKILTSANVSQLVPDWTALVGGGVGSSATVANGIVYINSNYGASHDGYMYAIDVITGATLWQFHAGSYDFGCAPTVANGIVYMGSFDHNLYAFDARTGVVLWKAPTGDRIGSSPTLFNGVIYIGSDDGKLYAFHSSNGAPIWSVPTGSAVRSSPAVYNGTVYVGSDDHKLYAINAATGAILWTFTTGDQVTSSPTISNGVVYVGSNDHTFYAFNATTGAVLWKKTTGSSIVSSPAIANGIVYIGSEDHKLYAIDAVKGTSIWTISTGNAVRSSPSVANGVVYVGSDDHKLYAIDAVTGTILWTFTTGNQVVSSPTIANGVVYVGSDDSNLYAFHLAASTS
jgi:outer membrane protein assembly factor BamB/serine/threonine protein kinase